MKTDIRKEMDEAYHPLKTGDFSRVSFSINNKEKEIYT